MGRDVFVQHYISSLRRLCLIFGALALGEYRCITLLINLHDLFFCLPPFDKIGTSSSSELSRLFFLTCHLCRVNPGPSLGDNDHADSLTLRK